LIGALNEQMGLWMETCLWNTKGDGGVRMYITYYFLDRNK